MNAAVPLRKQELPLSLNEAGFIRAAIADGLRVDGRAPFELRALHIRCGRPTRVRASPQPQHRRL
jgi:exosome complex RNA-binding protein Rrp42 (RNase PH superfamily)